MHGRSLLGNASGRTLAAKIARLRIFGAQMSVELVGDGPVTIVMAM